MFLPLGVHARMIAHEDGRASLIVDEARFWTKAINGNSNTDK